jgi:ABC-type transport system involved in Fe-S cluster assembly fused permease/ATPase subunit
MLIDPLTLFSHIYRLLFQRLIAAKRLIQLLNTKSDIVESEAASELATTNCKVEFRDMHFLMIRERRP